VKHRREALPEDPFFQIGRAAAKRCRGMEKWIGNEKKLEKNEINDIIYFSKIYEILKSAMILAF
jgi:hypothetical protein